MMFYICYDNYIVYSVPLNDYGSGLKEENYNFSCDPGYMLQGNVTSENTENGSGGLPSCMCDSLPIPAYATTLRLPSCGLEYQSQCTVLCEEGFTGDNVTYLCNVTNDPTMADWVAIDGVRVNQTCQRGLLPHLILLRISDIVAIAFLWHLLCGGKSQINYHIG